MRYYLFEKEVYGGHSYKKYTLDDLKAFFKPDDEASEEEKKAFDEIENITDMEFFITDFVNDNAGVHYHDYYLEEADESYTEMDLARNSRNQAKEWKRGFFEDVLGKVEPERFTTRMVENSRGERIEFRYLKEDEEYLEYYLNSFKGKTRLTEAQIRANAKYQKEKYEFIHLRLNKGEKDVIKAKADAEGKSVNQYIRDVLLV